MAEFPQSAQVTRRELVIMSMRMAQDKAHEALRHLIDKGSEGEADASSCLARSREYYRTAELLLSPAVREREASARRPSSPVR
jgi:hypothetical protein